MKRINNVKELGQLDNKEKFYVISDGVSRAYHAFSMHPFRDEVVVAVLAGDYERIVCFDDRHFKNAVFLRGDYIPKEVGQFMIDQLNEKIRWIEKIWLKNNQSCNEIQ